MSPSHDPINRSVRRDPQIDLRCAIWRVRAGEPGNKMKSICSRSAFTHRFQSLPSSLNTALHSTDTWAGQREASLPSTDSKAQLALNFGPWRRPLQARPTQDRPLTKPAKHFISQGVLKGPKAFTRSPVFGEIEASIWKKTSSNC